jgi:hypothetical protein
MEERIAPLEEIAEALKLIAEVLERIAMQQDKQTEQLRIIAAKEALAHPGRPLPWQALA